MSVTLPLPKAIHSIEVPSIELIHSPDCKPFVREVLSDQVAIYDKMGVTPITGYIL